MKKADKLSPFKFEKIGYGVYKVTFTTGHGDFYVAEIRDMPLIDATFNAENPRRMDVEWLKRMIKRKGHHFSKYGLQIY